MHVALLGYYGYGNLGDDALLDCSLKQLKREMPNASIIVLDNPANLVHRQSTLNTSYISRFSWKALLRTFLKTNMLIFGGGSILQDVTSTKSLYYYLGMILFAKLLRNQVHLVAQGVGPINNPFSRCLSKLILPLVTTITCRDAQSIVYITELVRLKKQPQLTADLAFLLKMPTADIARSSAGNGFNLTSSASTLGVVLRQYKGIELGTILEKIKQLIKEESVTNILLLPFQPEDIEYHKYIKTQLSIPTILMDAIYSPKDMLNAYTHLDYVLSMRLHGLVFAKLKGIPFQGIVYDPKVNALLDDTRTMEELKLAASMSFKYLNP